MIIPSWLVIGIVTIAIPLICNRFISSEDYRWFFQLRRPSWLTFERLIPLIWTVILICGGWSAYNVWQTLPQNRQNYLLMALYVLLVIAISLYTLVMCKARSLMIGTLIGATGFLLGLVLAILVAQISLVALWLLVPYLLWSPVGTFVTWQMMNLNPLDI